MQRQAASGTSRVKLLVVHSPESNCRKSPYSTITGLTGKDITPTRRFMTSADCRGVPPWAPHFRARWVSCETGGAHGGTPLQSVLVSHLCSLPPRSYCVTCEMRQEFQEPSGL